MFGPYSSLRTFCCMLLFCLLLSLSLAACTYSAGNAGNSGSTTTSSAGNASGNISTPTPSPTQIRLKVLSVNMSVGPALSGHICGSQFTETYTATFHFPARNVGGQVQFRYTTNNGRSGAPASLTISPGQVSATYHFTWSGQLPADHTAPGNGGVIVTSPNTYTSQMVVPSGSCTNVLPSAFKVISIELSASPSLSGHAWGTQFTETYSAIFHIAPNGPGGTIVFQYTTNNGRGNSSDVSLNVAAGQTTATYQFYWTGALPADHTAPGVGIVLMSAPNQGESPSASPQGQCS